MKGLYSAALASEIVFRTEHEVLDAASKKEMLAKLNAGEIIQLFVDITAFSQKPGRHNRNFVRFRDERLSDIAATAVNRPFLRDHAQHTVLAQGGVMTASSAVTNGTEVNFVQTVRLTSKWAVERALMDVMRSFSIGWLPIPAPGELEPVLTCSLCNAPMRGCVWEKSHYRGSVHGTQRVEWIFENAELVETSDVVVPAVTQVGLIDVREAHAVPTAAELQMFGVPCKDDGNSEEETMNTQTMQQLASMFSVPDNPDDIVKAAADMAQKLAEAEAREAKSIEKLAAMEVKVSKASEELRLAAEKHEKAAAELAAEKSRTWADILVSEGKLTAPGSPMYKHMCELHQVDSAKAEELAAAMPRVTPLGQAPQSDRARKASTLLKDGRPNYELLAASMPEVEKQSARESGVPMASYVEINYEALATEFNWPERSQ